MVDGGGLSLSTHVLDTARGKPAAAVAVRLLSEGRELFVGQTDADGRCPELSRLEIAAGRYRLEFEAAAYFAGQGTAMSDPPFLGCVVIDFGMAAEGGHYHVPLLLSPFGYSTYRGS